MRHTLKLAASYSTPNVGFSWVDELQKKHNTRWRLSEDREGDTSGVVAVVSPAALNSNDASKWACLVVARCPQLEFQLENEFRVKSVTINVTDRKPPQIG